MTSDKELMEAVFKKAEGISVMLWDASRSEVDEHVITAGLATCVDFPVVVVRLLLEARDG